MNGRGPRSCWPQFDVRPNDPELLYRRSSGGNQQKALLAKWLQTEPGVLLLHEPTQGVDVGARQQIFEMIGDAAERAAVERAVRELGLRAAGRDLRPGDRDRPRPGRAGELRRGRDQGTDRREGLQQRDVARHDGGSVMEAGTAAPHAERAGDRRGAGAAPERRAAYTVGGLRSRRSSARRC